MCGKLMVVGLALSGCLAGEAPVVGTVEGQLELGGESEPVQVLFLSEGQVAPFLQARLPELSSKFERAEHDRLELKARLDRWREERARAEEQLAQSRREILLKRLEVVRTATTNAEMATRRRLLTAQAAGMKQRVSAVRQQAEDARKEWERAAEVAARLEDGSVLLPALPRPLLSTTTHADGSFEADLAPGLYAVVASAQGRDGRPRVWLLWTRVAADETTELQLSERNLALSECGACVISPVHAVVKRD